MTPVNAPLYHRLRACLRPLSPAQDLPRDFDHAPTGDHILNKTNLAPEGAVARLRAAAVLLPIMDYADGTRLLLTRRTDHLARHAGQISFPGGRRDEADSDLAMTALREAQEEIGLSPDHVELLGALEPYATVTGFIVAPIVGWVRPGFNLKLDPQEVAESFEAPFDFLMDPRNHRRESGMRGGVERYWWAMPWQDRHIWGATAGMIRNLSELLAEAEQTTQDIKNRTGS